jgi:hypothetical protein
MADNLMKALDRYKPNLDLRSGGHYCGKGRLASHYSISQAKRRKVKV